MDRQTLRDGAHRYNALGVEGLISRQAPGREPAFRAHRRAEFRDLVIQGPDPEIHGVVRWRCVDLKVEVARRFSVEAHENTIGRRLHELGYAPLSPTGAELLFEVFSQLYEHGSTIVTANLLFEQCTSVLGSDHLTGALLDQLAHHVHILTMNGDGIVRANE
jgi:transposase